MGTFFAGEAAGATIEFRLAMDQGAYVRVGELGPDSTADEHNTAFTLRKAVANAKGGGRRASLGIGRTKANP